jgi:hypothetical protein
MGMGSFAVGSFVIGYDDLKNICPEEINAIENEKFFKEIGWGTIGQWLSWDDLSVVEDAILDYCFDEEKDDDHNQKVAEEISRLYVNHINNLQSAFNEKTGLTLYFDHYDEEGGDRYDNPNDKDGCIFCVDGMVQLTTAGEKYKDIITERRWTQFG